MTLLEWIAVVVSATVLVLLLTGCHAIPRIRLPDVGSVVGVKDPGKPAEVSKTEVTTSVPVPAGSVVAVSATGETIVTVKTPTVLTQKVASTKATTGTIDQTVAAHRIDKEQETTLAKHRILIGTLLLLGGIVVGFVLPGPIRWPMAGILMSGVGLLLVLMPNPPAWMMMLLSGAAVAFVASHYVNKHKTPEA